MIWTPPNMGRVIAPSYSLRGVLPGVHNLIYPTPAITLDSQTVSPTLTVLGGDAAPIWAPFGGHGENLTKQAGTPNYNQGSPFPGSDDDSVGGDGVAYWLGSTNSLCKLGTNDFYIEGLVRHVGTGETWASDRKGSGNYDGWRLNTTASSEVGFLMDAGASALQIVSAAFSLGTWIWYQFFGDRSGSAQFYVWGEASGSAVDISSLAASDIDSGLPVCLFASQQGGVQIFNGDFAYLGLYLAPAGWLSTHLQAAFARERTARLLGRYAHTAWGGATPEVI